MKLYSYMTLIRNEVPLRVGVSGTYEPAAAEGPEKVVNLVARDYDGEVALTEDEWREAEEILIAEYHEH